MPTILDSNVVLDILQRGQEWVRWSQGKMTSCSKDGPLVLNAIVFAEIAGQYRSFEEVYAAVNGIGLALEDIPFQAAHLAGQAHVAYRRAGGQRQRIVADFLIGAHAAVKGHRILTRDGARYRSYFPAVEVIAPDSHP